MKSLYNKSPSLIYIFLLLSTTASAVRGPDCHELGNCSSGDGSGIIGKIIVLIIVGGLFYEGIKESYEKRGAKGPAIILVMLASVATTLFNAANWGLTPLAITSAIAFTSVWWLTPALDRIFPEDTKKMENDKS